MVAVLLQLFERPVAVFHQVHLDPLQQFMKMHNRDVETFCDGIELIQQGIVGTAVERSFELRTPLAQSVDIRDDIVLVIDEVIGDTAERVYGLQRLPLCPRKERERILKARSMTNSTVSW